jgi:septal ring factor EnvC (AmiA/AmiB activator)
MPTVLELYEKLKPKLGEEEARSLLEFIESTVEQRAVTKADLQQAIASLREEMRQLEGALREEIRQGDASLREEIRQIDASLREEIHTLRGEMYKMRADLIKWSFAFWVGNVAVLSGIMFALLRGAR